MYTEGPKIGYTLLSININVYILYYIFFLNATEKKPIDTQAVCSLLLSIHLFDEIYLLNVMTQIAMQS
jgi:hypothetical protein